MIESDTGHLEKYSHCNFLNKVALFFPGQRIRTKVLVLATKSISICYTGVKKVKE